MQKTLYTKQQPIFYRLLLPFKSLIKPFLFFVLLNSAYSADIEVGKLLGFAKKQDKFIMFFHHIPGCPYCKAMLEENFKDSKTIEQINKKFIYVDIFTANNGTISFKDFKGSYKEFSKYIGAVAYPATIFMDPEGRVVHKAVGYRNIEEFLSEIKYVSTKSYQKMDLEAYIEKLEMENF